MRYLTKSRFKSAIECATKLDYYDDPSYDNSLQRDDFAISLAEGGHQVGALAKSLFANGIEIVADGHQAQATLTAEFLAREEVVLYEAAFLVDRLFVKVDLLHKQGDKIAIYEVKAKSFDSTPGAAKILGAKGQILGEFKPYLYDIAFQRHVVRLALGDKGISSFLVMPDKSKVNTVADLPKKLRMSREGRHVCVDLDHSLLDGRAAEEIFYKLPVDNFIDVLCAESLKIHGREVRFEEAIATLVVDLDTPEPPRPSATCRRCEFNLTAEGEAQRLMDGRRKCWSSYFGVTDSDLTSTVFDLYALHSNRTESVIQSRRVRLIDLDEGDIGVKEEAGRISQSQRQWLQCLEARESAPSPYVLRNELRSKLGELRYPLHFIDFETARSPIPYYANRRPYQLEFFQFSHHLMAADGQVTHASEYVDVANSASPNVSTIRALQAVLNSDSGSILHWWDYERTVLSEMKSQISEANEAEIPDRAQLIEFLDAVLSGGRLVDLGRKIVHETVFMPATDGSSSIKKFLPAILAHAPKTASKYAAPIYGAPGGICSKNFTEQTWVVRSESGEIADPYQLLGGRFGDDDLDRSDLDDEERQVENGGAAMIAYSLLQSGTLNETAASRLKKQLLRYCELDTLAMVMSFEGLQELSTST